MAVNSAAPTPQSLYMGHKLRYRYCLGLRQLLHVAALAQQLRPRGDKSGLQLANYEGPLLGRPPSLSMDAMNANYMEDWNWQYFRYCLDSQPEQLDANTPQWITISGPDFPTVSSACLLPYFKFFVNLNLRRYFSKNHKLAYRKH